jgi:uroporphyrinogen decarboxylase
MCLNPSTTLSTAPEFYPRPVDYRDGSIESVQNRETGRVKLLASSGTAHKPHGSTTNSLQQSFFYKNELESMADQAAKPLLATLKGERQERPPVWLMRQAGRYLPEYRALRAEKGGFLELVNDSQAAAEVTLQPIRRFGFDGAILFSDILVVPHAMGQDLWFEEGEGPRLAPRLSDAMLESLEPVPDRLQPVYETVRLVAAALDPETTFLGFAGSPWTVATYMIAGQGSKEQADARRYAYRDPQGFQAIIDAIITVTVDYLSGQIEAGVEAVQLFDSWAGSLSPAQFEQWVIAPNAAIVSALKLRHPDTPIIGFPKGAGGKLPAYARQTGVDALGIDETVDPEWAHANLPEGMPVQGNLDPLALIAGGAALDSAVSRILKAFEARPHVFNLGHGILPDAPIAHVEALIARLRR